MNDEKLLKHIDSLIELYHSDFKSDSSRNNDVKQCNCNSGNYQQSSKQPHCAKKKNVLTKEEVQKVSKALLELQRGLTGERNLAGGGYMQDKNFLGAYLLYYWIISYLQISFIANDIKCSAQTNKIRILDLGSGPAPATAALLDSISDAKNVQVEVTLVDSSEKALTLAKKILQKEFPNVEVKCVVCNFENKEVALTEDFDFIVSCHALNELWKNKTDCIEKRSLFLKKVSSHLAQNGAMIICEPALLLTSRNLIKVRDILLQKGLNVISPCMFSDKKKCLQCPVLQTENHTCHAEVKWAPVEPVASLAKEAGLDRESVKMTYFVFENNVEVTYECGAKDECTVQLTNDCGQKKNIVGTKTAPDEIIGRIVSEGMLNKAGRVRFLVCNGNSRIAVSAKKDDAHAKAIGFFNLQRYDIVKFSSLEIRGDKNNAAYGIASGTILTLLNNQL